jgi:3-oxoacyl-[acyl-carrier protein] reductase
MELSGKTALVTGASRGIGAAIARRLAGAGAHVAVNYAGSHDAAEALVAEIVASGGKAFAVQADVGSLDGIRAMLAACDAVFGDAPSLDILVNNAGVGGEGDAGSLAKCSEQLFDRMIAVNQKAPHFITQFCLERLRDGGRIVNIGSLGGRSALPPFAAYAATKRALQSLTMSTAVVVAPRGITCNLVAPGAVDTEFNSALLEKPGWAESTAKLTPMKRLGLPDDIAGAVMMLVRDEAHWVTGQIVEASGGLFL